MLPPLGLRKTLVPVVGSGPGVGVLLPVRVDQLRLLAVEPSVLQMLVLFFSSFAQFYLQVLGLHPVDVIAIDTLPHHLMNRDCHHHDLSRLHPLPTQLTKLTKALIKVMAPAKMTKRGWMPTWCLSESMSVPCVIQVW